MSFLSPSLLWLLIGLPTLAAIYVLLLRRRKHTAVRYANLGVIKEALGATQRLENCARMSPMLPSPPSGTCPCGVSSSTTCGSTCET